jgi:hypothetical protein
MTNYNNRQLELFFTYLSLFNTLDLEKQIYNEKLITYHKNDHQIFVLGRAIYTFQTLLNPI